MIDFCHLHVHTEYSTLDGFGKVEDYAKQARKLGFKYLACTDHGSVSGLIEFQKACEKEKIIPIFGCELYVVGDASKKDKENKTRFHATTLVKNQQGWENLLKILSYAYVEGFYYKPRVDYGFLSDHLEGLVILTGCNHSFVKDEGGLSLFHTLALTTDDVYLEVMPHDLEGQQKVNELCCDLSGDYEPKIPIVATNDCHYIFEDDWEVHEVLLAIQRKAKWDDKNRWKFNIEGLHLRTRQEMFDAFVKQETLYDDEINEALSNTVKIAEKCKGFRIEKQKVYLPKIPQLEKEGSVSNEMLLRLCEEGYENIFGEELQYNEEYKKRFAEEYDVIVEKDFSLYFLIVWELISWCKQKEIMVGPCRGSVGGSLIAYLLRITDLDPIEHNLLFYRFINENRIDYPDIDIDFEDTKRHLVREHLEEIYGEGCIASVSTFLRMKGKMAFRDVARVFDIPTKEVNAFAKLIDDRIDNPIDEAASQDRSFARKYPKVIKFASKLDGQIRGLGQHAAALIVSAEKLTESKRTHLMISRDGLPVINWEFRNAEYMGLMKLDVLALNLLSILNETKRLIGGEFDFRDIDLNDPDTLKEISAGHNIGVFQFSGYTNNYWAKQIGVDDFKECVAMVSLARPGPADSGMTEEYGKRKKKKRWKKKHEIYEEITIDTNGIIVYQEQVMETINKIAGLPFSTADKIRKVIGKKLGKKEFKPFLDEFLDGCEKTEIFSKREAEDFWEMLQHHASYSFNRAHATGYAMLGFWSAWLKKHYPTEFICASLTHGAEGKKPNLVKEAYRLGLSLVLPKVGISDGHRWIAKGSKLYIPFIEVKGIGESAIKEISRLGGETSKKGGFFFKETLNRPKGKLGALLDKIGAYDEDNVVPKDVNEYFQFNISSDPKVLYPNLFNLFPNLRPSRVDDVLIGKHYFKDAFKKKRFNDRELLNCTSCELRGECRAPVLPSKGLWNIIICGEAPGKDEDREGEGFVGRAGVDILWPELARYGLNRKKFHVTNQVKCYPSDTRTPKKDHINACSRWLNNEIKCTEAKLILAFGNTSLKAFVDRDSGIKDASGKTEWVDSIGAWVCWCVHPASVLYQSSNEELFKEGIKNFIRTIESLGGIDEILL